MFVRSSEAHEIQSEGSEVVTPKDSSEPKQPKSETTAVTEITQAAGTGETGGEEDGKLTKLDDEYKPTR